MSNDGHTRRRIRITQKSDPVLVAKICDYLGYGTVRDGFRFVIERKQYLEDFIMRISPFTAYHRRGEQVKKLTKGLH